MSTQSTESVAKKQPLRARAQNELVPSNQVAPEQTSIPSGKLLDRQALAQVDLPRQQSIIQRMGRTHGNRFIQRFMDQQAVSDGDTVARSESPDNAATSTATANFDPEATIDIDTASELDLILQNSRYLAPYIQEKLTKKSIAAAGKFIIYDSDPAFNEAYITKNSHEAERDNPAFKKEMALKMAFYEISADTIHLRKTADGAQGLHEAMHKFSEPGFRALFSRLGDEGMTQFFTDKVLEELELPPGASHGYGEALKFATGLVGLLGEPFAAESYFKKIHGPTVLAKLGITSQEYNKKYRAPEQKVYFLKYVKKLIRKSSQDEPNSTE